MTLCVAALADAAHARLLAEAAGKPRPIVTETARHTATQVGTERGGALSFQPLYDWIVAAEPDWSVSPTQARTEPIQIGLGLDGCQTVASSHRRGERATFASVSAWASEAISRPWDQRSSPSRMPRHHNPATNQTNEPPISARLFLEKTEERRTTLLRHLAWIDAVGSIQAEWKVQREPEPSITELRRSDIEVSLGF
jgi:hypothetical protein